MTKATALVALLLVLACAGAGVNGQLIEPQLPNRYHEVTFNKPFQGVNMCAYKEITDANGRTSLAWTCGYTEEGGEECVHFTFAKKIIPSRFLGFQYLEFTSRFKWYSLRVLQNSVKLMLKFSLHLRECSMKHDPKVNVKLLHKVEDILSKQTPSSKSGYNISYQKSECLKYCPFL